MVAEKAHFQYNPITLYEALNIKNFHGRLDTGSSLPH